MWNVVKPAFASHADNRRIQLDKWLKAPGKALTYARDTCARIYEFFQKYYDWE